MTTIDRTQYDTPTIENMLLNGVEGLTKATLMLRETTASLRATVAQDTRRHADGASSAGGELPALASVSGPA